MAPAGYDDGRIVCDDRCITIRWYYLWGRKRIRYESIRSFRTFDLGLLRGRWRIWGSGDLRHWFNLDASRPSKKTGIELDLGGYVRPCITPDEPDKVVALLEAHARH